MLDEPGDPFRVLPREIAPPPSLKARVVASLYGSGLLRAKRRYPVRLAAILAAALLVFVAGRLSSRWRLASGPAPLEYALLLYQDSSFDSRPGNRREYDAWADSLTGRGIEVQGWALGSTSRLLNGSGDERAGAGAMSGLFILRAKDASEALAIARTCPHLRHGGTISLRPVD